MEDDDEEYEEDPVEDPMEECFSEVGNAFLSEWGFKKRYKKEDGGPWHVEHYRRIRTDLVCSDYMASFEGDDDSEGTVPDNLGTELVLTFQIEWYDYEEPLIVNGKECWSGCDGHLTGCQIVIYDDRRRERFEEFYRSFEGGISEQYGLAEDGRLIAFNLKVSTPRELQRALALLRIEVPPLAATAEQIGVWVTWEE